MTQIIRYIDITANNVRYLIVACRALNCTQIIYAKYTVQMLLYNNNFVKNFN